jgi:hypothetical protein
MISMALDRLGEENTERSESFLSLQADIHNAQKWTESRLSDQFRKLPVEIFGHTIINTNTTSTLTSHMPPNALKQRWQPEQQQGQDATRLEPSDMFFFFPFYLYFQLY